MFPEHVFFEKWTDVIIVTLILSLGEYIYSVVISLLMVGISALIFSTKSTSISIMTAGIIIPILISCFLFTPVMLYLSSTYMTNFQIVGGFFVYLILSFVLGFIKVPEKSKNN